MSNTFGRWLRSKNGMWTIIGIVAVLLVVVVAGAVLGWWQAIADRLSGTIVQVPTLPWDPPANGYTCLPSCSETDGQFIALVGEDMDSFTGARAVVWIGVPVSYTSFELSIFDGDSGKDDDGNVGGMWVGNWDETTDEVVYTLYADPWMDGSSLVMMGRWFGNQNPMPNNGWYNITLNNVPEALAPSGHYFYRLEATRAGTNWGVTAFKLRSNAYLFSGQSGLVDTSLPIVGMVANWNDVAILWPQSGGLPGYPDNMGPSTYTGNWQLYIVVPTDTATLEFWDGDFDRGSSPLDNSADTDDPNTPDVVPLWAGLYAEPEGESGIGSPPDNFDWFLWRREPPVQYTIVDPAGMPIYSNEEPSGTEEWERFVLTTNPNAGPNEADMVVDSIAPGLYSLNIEGLDLHNAVWIRTNYVLCTDASCSPPEGIQGVACAHTLAYWKDNVNRVLQGRPRPGQETRASLERYLQLIALVNPLFRNTDGSPLTLEQAGSILQVSSGPALRSSVLTIEQSARQQNLAAWFNLAAGQVSRTTVVQLNPHGGPFEGTILEALLEAEYIMINGGDMERARDIADQINNAGQGANAPANLSCSEYRNVMPEGLQPPAAGQMPVAPEMAAAPSYDARCTHRVHNQYSAEIARDPFYGIRFSYQSGDLEIRNGIFDSFSFVLPRDQVAALDSMPLEAWAGESEGRADMEGCAFNQATTCGPVSDATYSFAFQFTGATDNGDGTYTLTFNVYNFTNHGLSHVTFGLPAGAVPTAPTGSYESVICP